MLMFRQLLRIAFFLVELCALTAAGYWGFHEGRSIVTEILFGVGSPLLIAVIWGAFVAPRAQIPVPAYIRFVIQLVVFTTSGLLLYQTGQRQLATSYLLVALVVLFLTHILKNELTGGR